MVTHPTSKAVGNIVKQKGERERRSHETQQQKFLLAKVGETLRTSAQHRYNDYKLSTVEMNNHVETGEATGICKTKLKS